MNTLLLAAVLAVAAPAAVAPCLGPDHLHRIGRFESWVGNDPAGFKRISTGNGVKRAVFSSRGNYSAGFQTVYGPGSLTTNVYLPQSDHVLAAWLGAQEPGTVAITVQDVGSGRYLNDLGSWQDGPADAITQTTAVLAPAVLAFSTEGAGRTLRVEIHSATFGVCDEETGLCDCSPGLCPTGWVDDVRLCGTR